MSKILLAGGAGFIGTNLCFALSARGWSIDIVDDLSTGSIQNVERFIEHPNVNFTKSCIVDFKASTRYDYVINLACAASPPKYQHDPIKTLNTNFNGVLNLLRLSEKSNAIFLQASTSEVYGDPVISPQAEDYFGNVNCFGPRACYDEGKRVAETLCYEFSRHGDNDVRIMRIFNTYGPYMDPADGRVVSNLINQAISGQNLSIFGDGTQTRSFQYVDDLVSGILKILDSDERNLGPLNLGSSFEFTILELAKLIGECLGFEENRLTFHPLPQNDPLQRRPDTKLAQDKLAWRAETSLEKGLYRTIKYFKDIKHEAH